jgi:hypothetical protein
MSFCFVKKFPCYVRIVWGVVKMFVCAISDVCMFTPTRILLEQIYLCVCLQVPSVGMGKARKTGKQTRKKTPRVDTGQKDWSKITDEDIDELDRQMNGIELPDLWFNEQNELMKDESKVPNTHAVCMCV